MKNVISVEFDYPLYVSWLPHGYVACLCYGVDRTNVMQSLFLIRKETESN
jgi:hypothetical protein